MKKQTMSTIDSLTVCLQQKNIGDAGLEKICSQQTHHIVYMNLRSNGLTAEGPYFISKTKWDCLAILYLTQNKIGDKGCKYLSRTVLPSIKKIGLAKNLIGDAGVFHLSKPGWKSLEQIYLFKNYLCLDAVKPLLRASWPSIKEMLAQQNYHPVYEIKCFILSQIKQLKTIGASARHSNYQITALLKNLIKEKYPRAWVIIY